MRESCTSARLRLLVACALTLAAGWTTLLAETRLRSRDVKLDVVHLTSRVVRGMLVREGPEGVTLKLIYMNPGTPVRIEEPGQYSWTDIKRIERITPAERQRLAKFIAEKQADREKFARLLHTLQLQPASWGKQKTGGLSYGSKYFLLVSDARADIVRRAAVRLEQIYAAYEDLLPPRKPAGNFTTIRLVRSLVEYRGLLATEGRQLLNPAFYDLSRNEILCACDLEQLGEELERTRKEHEHLKAQLRALKRELIRQFKEIPKARLAEIADAEQKIRDADRANNKKFEAATARLFRTLYHEAFHAYLANFVYPPAEAEVPRWLNEGLAQMFETATLDGGELFVGKPDPERVRRMHAAMQRDEWLPLADLLKSAAEHFLVSHAGEQEISDRYYLASWALAYYLTTERQKLGSAELDRYVAALKKPGADRLAAFAELVGQPVPAFEKSFLGYLRKLQASGSTAVP
jgi:hypothetical protein